MDDSRYKPTSMQNEGLSLSLKPPPSLISERFREMVREREDELRAFDDDDDGVGLSGDEIVRLYDILLSELSVNSKPVITDLTIIAGEQRIHGAGIADAICGRIVEAPVEQKLPSLYLLDSIVKNIGREYIKHFSSRLPEVFCDAYKQVHPNMHPALRHLFGTWSTVFPLSVLRKIELHLQFSAPTDRQSSVLPPSRASESPRPAHGIHVNPKYLEARRQFGRETADSSFQPPRGVSTTSQLYTHKHSIDYEDYNSDDGDIDISLVKSNRLTSSSTRGGPMLSGPEGAVDWKRNFVSGDSKNHVKHPATVRFNNIVDVDRTRALIDAYGIDKRTDMKHPNVEELRVNGIDAVEPTKRWQNSEEEEFEWENMSPTLADNSRKDVFSSSLPPSGGFRNSTSSASHLRQDWPKQPPFPAVNGSSIFDVPPSTDGLNNLVYRIRNGSTHIHGSSNPPEPWQFSQNVNLSSANQFGNNPRMPFQGSGILNPPVENKSSSMDYTPENQAGAWPSTHLQGSHGRPMLQTYQPNRPIRGQLDTSGRNNLLDSNDSILQNPMLPFSGQHLGPIPFSQSLGHTTMLPPHSLSQDMRHHAAPPASQLQRGYAPGHLATVGTIVPNPYAQSPMPNLNFHRMPLALPRGLPGASHPLPLSQPSSGVPIPPAGGDFSNLFSSLMAQGVISLNQTPAKEDLVGLEFNPDLLKVRYESAITALYSDLPRQCTTCGLRFKLQEAHSSHMDWHVTKNRVTRNRKQKPSRKWFVSVNMWLTGAEALGTDSVPNFLASEDTEEKKDDEELAVPADDDQKFCALCSEPFDDFYCDETDEWMYRGAVYMNATSRSTADMDRSQLGPIVHAKCRSDTGAVSEDTKNDLDFTEEGSQRKRMRI